MRGAPGLAGESIGAPHAEAAQLGPAAGAELAASAGQAFTDALRIGLTAAAVVAPAGAVLVAVRLPRVAVPSAAAAAS
jgi:hypothetical protein